MFKPELSTTVHSTRGLGLHDGRYLYAITDEYEQRLDDICEAGIKAVELGIGGNPEFIEEKFDIILQKVANRGLILNSVHYPCETYWMDLASEWESDGKEIAKWISKIMKIADKYNPRAHVFHPGGKDLIDSDYNRRLEIFVDTVSYMCNQTPNYVCLENMVGGSLYETTDKMLNLLNRVPKAQVVADVNHFLHEKPEDAILKLGNRVKTLHISDYDFVNERHLMPKLGKNNWNKILSSLETIGYDGRFNYEVNVERYGYTYKEIKENYDLLIEEYEEYKAKK